MGLEKIFFHEKAVEILLKVYEAENSGEHAYPLSISRDIGSPYSYISKMLGMFEENALVESEFEGRKRKIRLTDEGKKVAELLFELLNLLKKDFVSRKRLKELERIFYSLNGQKGEDALKILLPLKAELENFNSEDEEVVSSAKSLKARVEAILNEYR